MEPRNNVTKEVCELNQSTYPSMNRYEMFNILMTNAIDKIASGLSDNDYSTLFGSLSIIKSKSVPMKLNRSMKKQITESLTEQLTLMVEEENIEDKFNKLDSLVDECALFEGKETWRPNGNVDDHLRSHIMEKMIHHKMALEEYVINKEHNTEMLKQKVSKLRSEVIHAKEELLRVKALSLDTSVVDKIDGIIVTLGNSMASTAKQGLILANSEEF